MKNGYTNYEIHMEIILYKFLYRNNFGFEQIIICMIYNFIYPTRTVGKKVERLKYHLPQLNITNPNKALFSLSKILKIQEISK